VLPPAMVKELRRGYYSAVRIIEKITASAKVLPIASIAEHN
jgi:hypothetical protein